MNKAHFLQLEIRKKAGHFKWKAGKWDGATKREFTPESGYVDTYAVFAIGFVCLSRNTKMLG